MEVNIVDTKKILLITFIAVAILASVGVVSAGFFDGLFGEQQHDNVIEIDNITFNTTNVTKFKLFNETNGDKWYVDENDSGYNLHIINFNEFNGITTTPQTENSPSQTVNGVVIYTSSSNSGAHVGEPRYKAYIENFKLFFSVHFENHKTINFNYEFLNKVY